ncbi:MAG: LLM class flavin-dependent oxidoreductase [Acidobacteriota bacterium]|nr:MAG: LLM class flavin-dependent oxidoreductase [Acidobacteriota bacterium]
MPDDRPHASIELYTTCPATSTDRAPRRPGFYSESGESYLRRVVKTARWSEDCGFHGMLLYIDNSLADNWALAQLVIESTTDLVPLIATQPAYTHPYWVAKKIATLGHLYGRRIALNMLAGAFVNDLQALGDVTPHDRRYERMTEYTLIIQKLLARRSRPTTFKGEFYTLRNAVVHPLLPSELMPIVLMSGSSEAGMAAARRLGAVAVRYPKPVDFYEQQPLEQDIQFGVRLGIIARDDEQDAWELAHERFPVDRQGQMVHKMATGSTDSVWHKDLTSLKQEELTDSYPYWLVPFQNYKTFCPYLVGSYRRIAEIVARYINVGFRTFITDIPLDQEELFHQKIVFGMATKMAAAGVSTAAGNRQTEASRS